MFKPKVTLQDDYCEPLVRTYKVSTYGIGHQGSCNPCCDDDGGSIYVRGAVGLSAYEIAVKNGFVGTESQWLATMGGSIAPERINFTGATGEVVIDYSINSRRVLYPTPTFEVYITDGDLDISVGGYGVTITKVLGVINTIAFGGLFGDGYILLKK